MAGSIEAEQFIPADAGVPVAIRQGCFGYDRMTQEGSPWNTREKKSLGFH